MISIILAYLFGSISFAIILTKIFNLPDPRSTGSNNPGATNMLRLSGKKIGALTLLGDVLKAFIVVFMAKYYNYNSKEILFISLACFIGHLFPIYFKFKGGKGVAVTLGLLLGLNYVLGLFALFIWIIIAYVTKYSSLAALLTSPILSLIYLLFYGVDYTLVLLCLISALLALTHRKNIMRLINKQEPKLFNVTN
jgi:glycerol-3-phosphate acyltransferase PlsY